LSWAAKCVRIIASRLPEPAAFACANRFLALPAVLDTAREPVYALRRERNKIPFRIRTRPKPRAEKEFLIPKRDGLNSINRVVLNEVACSINPEVADGMRNSDKVLDMTWVFIRYILYNVEEVDQKKALNIDVNGDNSGD
jgi:hypothetical protein